MYVIINGVSSDIIQGLQVLSLPPITKPKMRRQVDTIDGRAGDIITELGYEAYDRTITVLLHHNYDLDAITAFFNTSGEIIFSNEPDKKYYFRLLEKIDYERAVQFKTANITFHVQPYKYPVNETPLTVSSTAWEGTDYDQTPYIFRAVSDSSVDVGNREVIEQITGGTVAWNQLLRDDNIAKAIKRGVTWSRTNGKFKLSGTASSTGWITLDDSFSITPITDHVYIKLLSKDLVGGTQLSNNTSWLPRRKWSNIGKCTSDGAQGTLQIQIVEGTVWDDEFYVAFIDLTQMFGSTIADYIYSLEQSTAGAGVSLFKSLFPKDYYAYNAGELMSVKTSARETVGKNLANLFDDGKVPSVSNGALVNANGYRSDYIKASPSTIYTVKLNVTSNAYVFFYDVNKTFISSLVNNAGKLTFTTPSNTGYIMLRTEEVSGVLAQLELGSTATSYVPYEKHTYPLSNIELRGIPKLVNNKLTYDGDIYKADGSVERLYGVRSYQSGDESLTDAITDGTNTVYKLSSPTTETANPYTEIQICSPYGTEEFIDDRAVAVPVGHKTKYKQINDRAEITVPNAGNVPSAPTIQLTGSGTVGVYLGNAQTLQVNIPEDGITIDTEAQDATSNGQLANRSVTGDYDSVRLQPGDNDVSFSGDVSAVITKYTRWV